MRDIRPDLKERLDAVEADREAIQKRFQAELDALSARAETLRDMIRLEDAKWATEPPKGEAAPSVQAGNEAIERAILSLLPIGIEAPHSSIRISLEGRELLRLDDPQRGRALQGILMSMRYRGLVEIVEGKQGVWRRAKPSSVGTLVGPQKETGANRGPGHVDLN